MVLTKEQAEREMQIRLAEMNRIVAEMNEIAIAGKIERVEFMGQYLKFGVKRGYTWEDAEVEGGYKCEDVRVLEFIPAASGPLLSEDYWSYSSFRCWPSDGQKRWLDGDGPEKIRTSYAEEADGIYDE